MSKNERPKIIKSPVPRADRCYFLPEEEEKKIGVWFFGIPGGGKSHLAKRIAQLFDLPMLDSDDPIFDNIRETEDPVSLANEIARMAENTNTHPVCVASVSLPADRSQWLSVVVSVPLFIAIERNPKAYDTWTEGSSGRRAIDRWAPFQRADCSVEGRGEEGFEEVSRIMKEKWPCLT